MGILVFKDHSKVTGRKAARFGFQRFWGDETGSLVIFALMLAMLMLMMGGIAVDVMRYESRRTSLQNTLDRSTLAAAALSQDRDAKMVVNDYFLKAGLAEFLTSVTVTRGLNFRNVQATASADTDPLFLHMMGIDDFNANGMSMAEQRVNNVEVMLVLDVSGSMNSNSRIVNLKIAAKNFVDTVLKSDSEDKISIGIVPFNGQVNLGPTLLAEFNAVNTNGVTPGQNTANVNCVDLPATAYGSASLAQYAFATSVAPDTLSITADADTYSGYGSMAPNGANKWCPPQGGNIVRLPSQNILQLQQQIDGLTAIGATSINAGMKWGAGLLDPSSRPIYSDLIGQNVIPGTLAGRPFEYTDPEAMKVIVLMTDGEHFAEDRVRDAYKTGLSGMFDSNADTFYSIFHASQVNAGTPTTLCDSRPYYVQHLNLWQSRPWNGADPVSTDCYVAGAANGATQMTWQQVWSVMRIAYVAYYYYGVPLGFGNTTTRDSIYSANLAAMRERTQTTNMDTQLQQICTEAKLNNVIVYGIAFEAPAGGQTQIRACSTDAEKGTHFFIASGSQIGTAFSAIANNISQLRLTQ